MSGARRSAKAAALVAAALGALAGAVAAHGGFAVQAAGGPLPVSTATMGTPNSPSATNGFCFSRFGATVVVFWQASGDAGDDVTVLRALSPGGPFVPIAVDLPLAGHFVDATTAFSTTFYYAVRTTHGSWQSPLSGSDSVRTPPRDCR